MFRYFDENRIQSIYQACFESGLANMNTLDTLASGINQTYAAGLDHEGPANLRLLRTLHVLNGVARLNDGSVPLRDWLHGAVTLSATRPAGATIRQAYADLDAM